MTGNLQILGSESTPKKPFAHLLRLNKDGSPDVKHHLELKELIGDTRLQVIQSLSGTLFREPMKDTGTKYDSRTVHIRELESDPSVVVREHIMRDDETLSGVAKSAADAEEEFAKLSKNYGVRVAAMQSVSPINSFNSK